MTPTENLSTLATCLSLLSRLRRPDGDLDGWQTFLQRYSPLVRNLARRRGLREDEAAEAVQETLIAVARAMPEFQYDPARCSFKSWLRSIAERKVADQYRRRQRGIRKMEITSDPSDLVSLLDNIPDPASLVQDEAWDREWRECLLRLALERVKTRVSATQFQLYHQHVILGRSPRDVACAFEVSVMSVYLARSRVGAQVRRVVRELEAADVG